MQRFKGRPSAATVLAFVALVVALSGSAVATPVANIARQITGANIKNGTIKGADVKNGSLSGADIHNGSIGAADIGTFQVKDAEIAPDAIGGDKVKPDSLDGSDIIESRLGQVPSAAHADSAGTLQGKTASDFVPASALKTWNVKLHQSDDVVLVKTADLELHAVCDPAGTVASPQSSTHYYILNSGSVGHGFANASDGTTGSTTDFNPGDSAFFNYDDIGDTAGVVLPNGASMTVDGNFIQDTSDAGEAANFGGECAASGAVTVTTP